MFNANTITISKAEYEKFIRDSEKLATLVRFVGSETYINSKDLRLILDIKNEEKEEGKK